jgi:hypothetical protein
VCTIFRRLMGSPSNQVPVVAALASHISRAKRIVDAAASAVTAFRLKSDKGLEPMGSMSTGGGSACHARPVTLEIH